MPWRREEGFETMSRSRALGFAAAITVVLGGWLGTALPAAASGSYDSIVISGRPANGSLSAGTTWTYCIQAELAGTPVSGATVYLSFDNPAIASTDVPSGDTAGAGGTTGGSAAVGATQLTSTPTGFATGSACVPGSGATESDAIDVTYTSPNIAGSTNGGAPFPVWGGRDFVTGQDLAIGPSITTTAQYQFSPVTSYVYSIASTIAPSGTLAMGQPVTLTLTAENLSSAAVGDAAVLLSLGSTSSSGGSATAMGASPGPTTATAINSSPARWVTESNGQVSITYTAASSPVTYGVDTITAQNHPSFITISQGTAYDYQIAGAPFAVSSPTQYTLHGSDGTTWNAVDPSQLSETFTPNANSTAVSVGNADMWTSTAGYNQDLGIRVTPAGGSPTVVAWKESGGFAGTFSPNAAAVQGAYSVTAGTTYTVELVWKANKSMPSGDTIWIGAGHTGAFSPSTLSTALYPTSGSALDTATSTSQYELTASTDDNGSTWRAVDATRLSLSITPSANSVAELTGNADLWTANAGYNQDLGIQVTPSGGSAVLAAWKESGGFAGTFSPNAAMVQTLYPLTAGTTYTITLEWKTNKPMPSGDSIFMAAGGASTGFSPSSLFAVLYPTGAAPASAMVTTQYHVTASSGDNGSAWRPVDGTNLSLSVTPSSTCDARITGNADLWTANAGYNQDLGIEITPSGGSPTVVAWKESGGFAGTFSPNAAFVQALYPLAAGTYTVELVWKSNLPMPVGDTIYIAAGTSGTGFSPTSLISQLYC